MTERAGGERKLPGRRRVALRDDRRSWARHSLPPRRVWPLTALFAAFGVGLITLAAFDVAALARYFAGGDTGFASPVFDAFGAIFWGMFGLVCSAVALMTWIGTEEIRVGHGLMTHVARVGPLRIFNEIDLAQVRNVRTAGYGEAGDSRIYFDYGDLTLPFGGPQPGESADAGVELIQRAIAARGGEAPPPAASSGRSAPPAAAAPTTPDSGVLSLAFLIGANLVPLVGVLALGWDLGQLMVLFWAENAVVGLFGVAKLIVVERWLAVISAPFFVAHFGFFMALHFIFIYYFFVAGLKAPDLNAAIVLASLAPLRAAILAMFVSHGVSFFSNFLARREYVGRKMSSQMAEPYKRVMVLHVTIIFGGFAVLALGQPLYALLILVVLKIAVDLHAHLRERRTAKAAGASRK